MRPWETVFGMTDYFGAGKMSLKKEVEQGKMIMDVCKAAGVEHFVFMSLIDCDEGGFPENVFHIKSKRLMVRRCRLPVSKTV